MKINGANTLPSACLALPLLLLFLSSRLGQVMVLIQPRLARGKLPPEASLTAPSELISFMRLPFSQFASAKLRHAS